MPNELDSLRDDVAANPDFENSLAMLIKGIAQQIKANATDPQSFAGINALMTTLTARTDEFIADLERKAGKLASAVVENTRLDPRKTNPLSDPLNLNRDQAWKKRHPYETRPDDPANYSVETPAASRKDSGVKGRDTPVEQAHTPPVDKDFPWPQKHPDPTKAASIKVEEPKTPPSTPRK